jgi:hypothetical protein
VKSSSRKAPAKPGKLTTTEQMSEKEIDALLSDLADAKTNHQAWETANHSGVPSEIKLRNKELPVAKQVLADLETKISKLRGDIFPEPSAGPAVNANTKAKLDGRMLIQQEASEHWIRLKASGANPSVHSICDHMARWCADQHVTTHTGTTPTAGTIRNTILAGSSGWEPPTHSRDQAKEHVARLAQVAQSKPASDTN